MKLADYFECNLFSYAGVQDDRAGLITKYPDQKAEIESLKDKYIMWLTLRFGDNKAIEEVRSLQECVHALLKYQSKEVGISQKYRENSKFKELIDVKFPPASRGWDNPADILKMSADQMSDIAILASKPKKMVEGLSDDKGYSLPEGDRIGKVGEWNLWLPSSRENSCKIAGGANGNCILFYVIKDNPQEPRDWLSIAFKNGNPYLTGENDNVSVDGLNKGLTRESLQHILGGSYDQVMTTLQQKSDSLGGKSPAYGKIEEAAKDPRLFSSLIMGNTADEADPIIKKVIYLTRNVDVFSIAFDKTEDLMNLDAIILHNKEFASKLPDKLDKIIDKVINNLNQKFSYEEMGKLSQISKRSELLPITIGKISKILIDLAKNEHKDIREYVAENVNTPLEVLTNLAEDGASSVREKVAKNVITPPELLANLAKDKDYAVRCRVAESKNTPSEILKILARDESPDVKLKVINNKNTPPESLINLIIDLAGHKDDFVRIEVAKNNNTPPEILSALAKDNGRVRREVAENINATPETLAILAGDGNDGVRRVVAENVNATPETLAILARDEDYRVRRTVAENINATPETLAILARDEDDRVRRTVTIRREVTENINATPETLAILARDEDDRVRRAVAKNNNTPPESLSILARDEDYRIRRAVAENSNTSPEILITLTEDGDDKVRFAANKNKNNFQSKTAYLFYRANLFYKMAALTTGLY